jgi:hypothetical protein
MTCMGRQGSDSEIPPGGTSASAVTPDPEVLPKAKRRAFTAAYKSAILERADRCTEPGQIGAMLRQEGLYSSHLTKCATPRWRRPWRRTSGDARHHAGFEGAADRRARDRAPAPPAPPGPGHYRGALAWLLVPSNATVPSFKSFISFAMQSTCTNSASISLRNRLRNGAQRVVVRVGIGRDVRKR